jgi:hypothetical protein
MKTANSNKPKSPNQPTDLFDIDAHNFSHGVIWLCVPPSSLAATYRSYLQKAFRRRATKNISTRSAGRYGSAKNVGRDCCLESDRLNAGQFWTGLFDIEARVLTRFVCKAE